MPSERHPLLTHVDDRLRALRSWTSEPGQNPLALAHVRALLCVLDEMTLLMPLSSSSCLLDGFLTLADAYGSFLATLLALRQHTADLRAAVRRRDQVKLASAACAQCRAAKELVGLATAVGCCSPIHATAGFSSELEVARTVSEAVSDTAAASASVFHQVAFLADAVSSSSSKKRSKLSAGEKMQRDVAAAALARLHELEQCVSELESDSENVFRSLLHTKVSLLNIDTPSI